MKYAVFVISFFILVAVGAYLYENKPTDILVSPITREMQKKKPLLAYSFENLAKTSFTPQPIIREKKHILKVKIRYLT